MELSWLAVWIGSAFAGWLGLSPVLKRLRVPSPELSAAILSWVGTGLTLPWLMAVLTRSLHQWSRLTRWLAILQRISG